MMGQSRSAQRVGMALIVSAGLGLPGLARKANALVVETGLDNVDELSLESVYPDFPYFGNIGQVGTNGTGVYLGNGLVLSATHVNAQNRFTLDGVDYTMGVVEIDPQDTGGDRGSLNNPDDVFGFLTDKSDIRLWRLSGGVELDLPSLPIVADKATMDNETVMIGTGVITDEPDGSSPFTLDPDETRLTLWGNNRVSTVFDGVANAGDPLVPNIFGRNIIAFTTTFNSPGAQALDHEAQATPGDSGAPAFVLEDGVWKLAGVAHSITGTAGQAAYGDRTFFSDLSFYDDQINAFLFKNGDFNEDFLIDAGDIDALFAAIDDGQPLDPFDLNTDGLLDLTDADYLIENILGTTYGDANLDGRVDGEDFRLLKDNLNLAGGWAQGDFTGDALVDLSDYLLFRDHFGFGTNGVGAAETPLVIPTPASLTLLALAGLAALRRRGMWRSRLDQSVNQG